MTTLWLVDPKKLKLPTGTNRKIGRKPLIDLGGLHEAIKSGDLGDDHVWLATKKCNDDLQDLQWSIDDLLDCIGCLQSSDHRGAVWCKTSAGEWVACDDYAIQYDDSKGCRSNRGLVFYLKFSIDEAGSLELLVISAHLSP